MAWGKRNEARYQRVIELAQEGHTQATIAGMVGVSQSTVSNYLLEADLDPTPDQQLRYAKYINRE
jgi:predicted transcriptional regulator